MREKFIIYPIIEKKSEKDGLFIRAGVKQIDEKKIVHFEGVSLTLPDEKATPSKLIYAVMSAISGEERDWIFFSLHAHNADSCCEHDTEMKVSLELVKKWTGLTGSDIDNALSSLVYAGATYNFLATMPRMVKVKKEAIEIWFGAGKQIDSMNVCNWILNHKYPLDMKVD